MVTLNTIVLASVKTKVFAEANIIQDNSHMELAERIKKAREHAELSQEDLADAIGCSVDLIRKLEQGNRKTTTFIVKIATACKVRPEWLDDESGEMTDGLYVENQKIKRAVLLMQDLPDYALDEAIKSLDSVAKLTKMASSS